jgi:hypothetical protein
MGRRQPKTAPQKILSLVAWTRRAGFYIAELQDALLLLLAGNEERRR